MKKSEFLKMVGLSVNKEYNLKQYHETNYKGYNEYKPIERKGKLEN